MDIVVLGEVCYTISNNAGFSYVPLVIAFVVGLAIVVYKTYIGDCTFVKAYSTFITVDKCVMILDAIARALSKAGITIGTYYVVQAYIQCSLLDRNIACSVINKLIVAQLIYIAGKRCIINLQAVIICAGIRSVAVALVGCILSVSFIAYACAILQAYLIAVDDAVLLQAYIAVCFQAFLATVFRAGINIIQVNLARQNLRYAMNCRCCAAFAIIYEFIIACKAAIKLNACLPLIGSLILSTLFIPNSNNTCIIAVLDCILRINDSYLAIQLCLHSVVEAVKSINAQCIVMVFQKIAIRSVNSITGNIQHLFGNCDIIHGKVITQVVGAYFATAGNLSGPQPAAVGTDVLQIFALQQAVVVLISCKGIVVRIICSQLAAINPAGDIKMVCCIINPTFLQVAIYRNLSQEHLQQRVSAFIVKLPGCILLIKSIAVQLLGILAVFCQRTVFLDDIAVSDSTVINVGVAIYFIAINIAYIACIAAYNICHIAIACYRSSAISVAQLAFSRITANDTADIASAADCTAIGISIIIKLSAISISCACFGLGYCYYAVEHLVQRAAVSTGNAADVAALLCLDHTGVIACRQRAAVIAKQTADVFSCKRCNSTVCCIIGACLNRTIIVNLILIIIVLIIATTGDNTMVNTNDATDICYTADITIYSVHQGGIADIRASAICLIAIYADNTAGAVFFRTSFNRSIAMHFALIFHDDMGNIRTVFTDDASSTTSQSNNGTGVDNAYAFIGSTGNIHFIFADNATDIVFADNQAFIAVAHAQELAYLAAFACVSADNAAYIGSLRSIHSGSVGRIGDDANVFTGNAAEELGVRCNYRVAF